MTVQDITWNGTLRGAQFQISYRDNNPTTTRLESSRIRSLILGSGPVLVELDTTFMTVKGPERKESIESYLQWLQAKGIPLRHRKQAAPEQSWFSKIFLPPQEDSHHILIYTQDLGKDILGTDTKLPTAGIRYYKLANPGGQTDYSTILDGFFEGRIDDDKKLGLSECVMYDNEILGLAGLIWSGRTSEDLRTLLGIPNPAKITIK